MATALTVEFFNRHTKMFTSPFLEIGSLIDSSYVQFSPKSMQKVKEGDEYIGIDIFPGEGVDLVLDLASTDFETLKEWKGKFKTVHVHYVMEHVKDIFTMVRNIDYITAEDGVVCFSAPFIWRLHRIPLDMWRYTPQSVDFLFKNFKFTDELSSWSTRKNLIHNLENFPELDLGKGLSKQNFLLKSFIKIFRKLKLDNNFFQERALMYEVNLMMIGVKKSQETYTYLINDL